MIVSYGCGCSTSDVWFGFCCVSCAIQMYQSMRGCYRRGTNTKNWDKNGQQQYNAIKICLHRTERRKTVQEQQHQHPKGQERQQRSNNNNIISNSNINNNSSNNNNTTSNTNDEDNKNNNKKQQQQKQKHDINNNNNNNNNNRQQPTTPDNNQQRSDLVKTRAQVRNVMVFLMPTASLGLYWYPKSFFGSFPSRLARCLRVKANAFSTLCMPGLELVKRAHKASTCAVAVALLPIKLVRLSARFIWLTIDSALLSPPTSFTFFCLWTPQQQGAAS